MKNMKEDGVLNERDCECGGEALKLEIFDPTSSVAPVVAPRRDLTGPVIGGSRHDIKLT